MRYWNDNRKSCEHVEPREDWKESIEKWIDWMDAIGRTNDTLRTRWYQIVRFSKAVDKSITDVTEDDLIFYLAGMGTEGRRGVRSCVKVFYQWSMKRGLARRNPADEVPTVPMTLPSGCICPEENIEQGLASPDENARLAVMLGAFCGLRRIEMTRINLKTDLEENAEGMVLHVHGKGNKERRVAVADAVWERLAVWLEARAGDPCPNVFLAVRRYGRISTGHSITSSAVYQILKTRSSQSGVEDFSPHDLRRTFATRLLGAGTDINLVRKAMGHASVLTTQRYDKREDEEVEEATRKILI